MRIKEILNYGNYKINKNKFLLAKKYKLGIIIYIIRNK